MHEFDFINRPKELLTPEVVALLTRLHECRGRQELFIEAEPDVLFINDSNGLCERQFGCVFFCIKKLPSVDGTDGSEGMMETATGVS